MMCVRSATFAALLLIAWRIYRLRKLVRYTWNPSSSISGPLAQTLVTLFPTYQAPWWLVSGVLQTVSTEFIKSPVLQFRNERIHLSRLIRPAGATCCPEQVPEGTVSLDWLDCDELSRPIILIVPGLTGSSEAGYVRRSAHQLHANHGFRVACLNPRGRGGNKIGTPFLYSAGYTQDLRRVVDYIKSQFPAAPLSAVGYSLGSNYLAKFVGEQGEDCKLCAAVCLACPVDCMSISNSLGSTFVGKYIMDPILVGSVQNVRQEIEEVLREHPEIDLVQVAKATTMHEFDDAAIAPMFSFACASDYYRESSAGLHLSSIRRPVLFIHANNDPIIPGYMIKMDNFRSSPFLISLMTEEGGHSMDWPTADLSSWSAKVIGTFLHDISYENKNNLVN